MYKKDDKIDYWFLIGDYFPKTYDSSYKRGEKGGDYWDYFKSGLPGNY